MTWSGSWRGRWIWDRAPDEAYWWRSTAADDHVVYLRRTFTVSTIPARVLARATCDSRYVLFLNGDLLGRGPVRSEPEFLGWDEYDLAEHVSLGANVLVAQCRYYGRPGPWWVPAAALGSLGRGSFCFETAEDADLDLRTGPDWRAVPASWVPREGGGMHAYPSEVVDGRLAPAGLHDPAATEDRWQPAVVLAGRGHGTVLDRPPAAPYSSPQRRPIPQLTSTLRRPTPVLTDLPVRVELTDDPAETWSRIVADPGGDRRLTVSDVGEMCLGHVHLTVEAPPGSIIDAVAGEDIRGDGLPETSPREWAARYICGDGPASVCFFDPVGLRYVGVHHPPDATVSVEVEEIGYPRPEGAAFDCDDPDLTRLWRTAARTVDVCSSDAFLDCPGREQRAWIADSYVQILVSYVTNPDWRLVRHHLRLTAQSRFPSGLLAGAAACDFSRIGFTMPEYSLHWLRALASYWNYSGDEAFVRSLLPVADGILERYEQQRGQSGLLENFPGWVFLDWAQVDRDVITAAHDALYAAALCDYADLPGASDVSPLQAATNDAFEALWDEDRHVYVDAIGKSGPSRRMSQHTNALALLGGLVAPERAPALIERITDPGSARVPGRLVVTKTSADFRESPNAHNLVPVFQYQPPTGFDPECDVVAAQPWFCRFLHEALFRHDRRDLILDSLRRFRSLEQHGTLQEFWHAAPGAASRCHGWSASPAFDLTTYVLGVRPAAPGYAAAIVDPYLGPLERAAGRVPTPRGWISVTVEGTDVEVAAPDDMPVEVVGAEARR